LQRRGIIPYCQAFPERFRTIPVPHRSARSFIGRVRDQLGELSPTERRLGDFILDFPGELASYTATELATLARVSNSTVTRFFKSLGYDSFDIARRQVRAEQKSGAALLLSSAAGARTDASTAAHVAQGHHNIDTTFNRLPEPMLTDLAQSIVAARQVIIIGYRSSHAFATYLRWQIFQAVENVKVVPGSGETMGEYVASFAPTDCVIAFGLRRAVPQLGDIIAAAASSKAAIAYITDRVDAIGAQAKFLIRCDTHAPGPLYNHVAIMAVCDLLATKVLEAAGPSGRKRMASIESAHDSLGEVE
jgi:DNA-binding MurR/RpiR family transcriptional regulator